MNWYQLGSVTVPIGEARQFGSTMGSEGRALALDAEGADKFRFVIESKTGRRRRMVAEWQPVPFRPIDESPVLRLTGPAAKPDQRLVVEARAAEPIDTTDATIQIPTTIHDLHNERSLASVLTESDLDGDPVVVESATSSSSGRSSSSPEPTRSTPTRDDDMREQYRDHFDSDVPTPRHESELRQWWRGVDK